MEPPHGPPAWVPCVCEVGVYFCTIHAQHAHDCPCPDIEDWAASPYQSADQDPQSAD